MIVGDEVDERGSGPVRHEDDTADGWFPESVAVDYDVPGGANAPEVVEPAAQVLIDLAGGGPVLEFAVGTGRSPLLWLRVVSRSQGSS